VVPFDNVVEMMEQTGGRAHAAGTLAFIVGEESNR